MEPMLQNLKKMSLLSHKTKRDSKSWSVIKKKVLVHFLSVDQMFHLEQLTIEHLYFHSDTEPHFESLHNHDFLLLLLSQMFLLHQKQHMLMGETMSLREQGNLCHTSIHGVASLWCCGAYTLWRILSQCTLPLCSQISVYGSRLSC